MAFHVRDALTDSMVRELARKRGVEITDAIKLVVGAELKRDEDAVPFRERIRRIQEEVLSRPATGLEADKAFYDSLNDEEG